MSFLILVRHGQSVWNLEKRFTGWVDVDLTENGKLEAKKAGNLIKANNINIDIYYSSFQLRAKNTLKLVMEVLKDTKVSNEAWQLNERHYGALTGLNKDEMKIKIGEDKVHQFRRSWDLRPDPLDRKNPYHPLNIKAYKNIQNAQIWAAFSYRQGFDGAIDGQELQYFTPIIGINYKKFMFSYTYTKQTGDILFDEAGYNQITLGFNFGCRTPRNSGCPNLNYAF